MAEEQSTPNLIDESANLGENVDPVLEKPDHITTDEGEKDNHGENVELELSKPTDAVEEPQYRSPAEEPLPVEAEPEPVETEPEPMETSVHEDPLQSVEGEAEEKICETDDQPEQMKQDEGSAIESEEVDKASTEVLLGEAPEVTPEVAPEEAPVETRMEEPVPEEPEGIRMKINIKTQSEASVVSVGPDATVAELKLAVGSHLKLSVDRVCLIFSGKMLLDEETLQTHDISDDSTVYLIVRPRQPPASDSGASFAFPFGPAQFSTLGTTPLNFVQLQQQLQKQMMNNPEMIRQMVDNPLVQQLMANPAVMKEMMMSAPQSRELLERNPEISDLLNNPEVMRQTLDMARNPATLETLLTQVEQERDARNPSTMGSIMTQVIEQDRANSAADGSSVPTRLNIPGFNLGANATLPDSITLLQQLAGNPQVVQQMLQAPYMPTIMEGLAKNPHWAQQMIAQNPLFSGNPHLQQQMAVMMPQYIQQMQNPEMQTLMTNPKALQAMLRIQQGMNVLQSEAPNLASSVGLPYLSVPPSAASFGAMPFPAAAGDAGRGAANILGAQYDPFSVMMSQIIQQMANRQMTQPPEQRYVEQLDRLSSMGFSDRETNLQVLIGTFGDVTAAVEHLMRARNI